MDNGLFGYSKLSAPGGVKEAFMYTVALAKGWLDDNGNPSLDAVKSVLGQKSVGGIDFIDGRVVTGAEIVNFFTGNATTYTNLSSFQRPDKEFSIIQSLRFREGVNATVNETVWDSPGIATVINNAFFTISVNGVVQLKRYPLFASVQAAEDINTGRIDLPKDIFIGDQEEYKLAVEFENAPAVANTNMMVELIGIGSFG